MHILENFLMDAYRINAYFGKLLNGCISYN